MTKGPTSDVRLSYLLHSNRSLHARIYTDLLQRIRHYQRIHDSAQHTSIISLNTIHARFCCRLTPPKVSASDNQSNLNSQIMNFFDFFRHLLNSLNINTNAFFTGKSFT